MRHRKSNSILAEIGPIERLPITAIKEKKSFRIFKKETLRQAARFMEAFGSRVPILVDADNEIVEGEIWFCAAKHLGLPDIAVLRITGLTPNQLIAYRIGVQRIPQSAEWDDSALADVFKQWSSEDLDFDVELTGFSAAEMDFLIESTASSARQQLSINDGVTPADIGSATTQLGDLWLAGDHRVLCGNSLDAKSIEHLLGREKAAVVITDPPYNVAVHGHVGGKGRIRHREFAMASGEMKGTAFAEFLQQSMQQLAAGSIDGSIHYLFMDWRHAQEILAAGSAVYTELKNIVVWKKANGGMGSFYRSQHELVFVYKKGKGKHRNNIELGKHGRNRTNVWEYAGANGFDGRNTDEGALLSMHPTVKPVQMIADALLDSSARGEIVLDIFHGSGSTLIAAERTGRRLYGIEIDPIYIDVAIRRWQRHTGQRAVHQATGLTFDQTSAARHKKAVAPRRSKRSPPRSPPKRSANE
jgi:DNA modification methylase